MNIFIDLFSGLGGASWAFDQSPNWKTIKIDNNEDLLPYNRGLHIMDVFDTDEIIRFLSNTIDYVHDEEELGVEKIVVWASPPCQQYSYANSTRSPEDFDNTLLTCTIEILHAIPYDYYIIENVAGAAEEFSDILGHDYKQRIKAMYLWGHFPLIAFKDSDALQHYKKLDAKGSRKLRPNYRACIPRPVSEALLSVLEHQRLITDY